MKHILILLLVAALGGANAQKAEIAKPEKFTRYTNGKVSMYLKIPAEYTVVSCRVGLQSMGDIQQQENSGNAINKEWRSCLYRRHPAIKYGLIRWW